MREAPFSKEDATRAIQGALCWADALRAMGYEPVGGNIGTLQRWARRWEIPTDHFDANAVRARATRRRMIPLGEVLVENSTYSRSAVKRRLLASGLKSPVCEQCGQGEIWRGRRMSLILDHINGVRNDHRLENLQIVCPNCAATLATHCGRNLPRVRACRGCAREFAPQHVRHRYCSLACFNRTRTDPGAAGTGATTRGIPRPETRKAERPPLEVLLAETTALGFSAVGRKYGVSDNAVRKWIVFYEREEARRRADEEAAAS